MAKKTRLEFIAGQLPELTRDEIKRRLAAKGIRDIAPVNRIASYYDTVENAAQRVANNPMRVRLSNQEAHSLAQAWRRFEGDGWELRFPFSKKEEAGIRKWYERQTKRARRDLPAPFRRMIREYDETPTGVTTSKNLQLAFKPSVAGEPIRKFRSGDSLARFLSLPHYKDARERLFGTFGVARIDEKTGAVKKFVRKVKVTS